MLRIYPSCLVGNGSWFADLWPEVPLGVSRSRLLFSVGDATLSFVFAFTNLAVPFLALMILLRNSDGTVS